jgi:glycyl-tRNA synthetase beta chain
VRELFFEVGVEEIPARLLEGARRELGARLASELGSLGLAHGGLRTWATPRRLALAVEVAPAQAHKREEVTGPPVRVAFDPGGQPTKAALAFADKVRRSLGEIERRATPKGEYLVATVETPGRPAAELLPEALVRTVLGLTWPKAMRWGERREVFIRPLQWLVALFGGELLPVAIAGLTAGRLTRGHRFLAPGPFEVRDAASWLETLRKARVEPDFAVRRGRICDGATELAARVGGRALLDEGLVDEVASLCESPMPLLGTFEEEFLEIPAQVLVTSMGVHQKYFAVERASGGLANAFVAVADTEVRDARVVSHGNAIVLRARLKDARFFFQTDAARPLEAYVGVLAGRTFLEGLGSMKDKAERLRTLARALCGEFAPGAAALAAERAGYLAKADLATEMVGEFPTLQGEMGRDYARLWGEPDSVAQAIFEHYLPRFAGDRLPETPAGAAVALADRLDTVLGCFALGLEPTGSADPYAVRRQALGVLRLLEEHAPRLAFTRALELAREAYSSALSEEAWQRAAPRVLEFFRARLKATLAADHPADLTEAVLEAGFERPREARERLQALGRMKASPIWDELALAVKRVAKIIQGQDASQRLDPDTLALPAERSLYQALVEVRSECLAAFEAWRFDRASELLAGLKPAIDRFFDEVMVMSEVPAERARRLALLSEVGTLFHRLAAFDKVST